MSKLTIHANISLANGAKREKLDGIDHLVIPCIAIQEGVLNNIYYSAAELESFANTWNGVPVPVNHPSNAFGEVTANSVECENTCNIGKVFEARFEDGQIKCEIWINIGKANKLGFENVIDRLENSEDFMEVSTGLFAEAREESGVFNGVKYEYVISNIRPDHLALLPDDIGACSVSDGCGALRTNCTVDEKEKDFWNTFNKRFTSKEGPNGEKIYVPVNAETITKNKMKEKKKLALINSLSVALANGKEVTQAEKDKLSAIPDEMLLNMAEAKNIHLNDEGEPVEAKKEESETPKEEPTSEKVETKEAPVANGLTDDEKATLKRLQANENARLSAKRKALVETNDKLTREMVANFDESTLNALLANSSESDDQVYGIGGQSPAPKNNTRERPKVLLG